MSKVLELTTNKQGLADKLFEGSEVELHNPLLRPSVKVPFKDGEFDIVFAHFVLNKIEWFKGVQTVVEWARALKDGGTLHLAVPSQRWLGASLARTEVGTHVKVLLYGSQQSKYEFYRSCYNVSDLRMIFEAAGLATVKARTGPCEIIVGDQMMEGEQVYMVGQKQAFVKERLMGEVLHEQSKDNPVPKRRRRRSRKKGN
jgi:hypothetical protein